MENTLKFFPTVSFGEVIKWRFAEQRGQFGWMVKAIVI